MVVYFSTSPLNIHHCVLIYKLYSYSAFNPLMLLCLNCYTSYVEHHPISPELLCSPASISSAAFMLSLLLYILFKVARVTCSHHSAPQRFLFCWEPSSKFSLVIAWPSLTLQPPSRCSLLNVLQASHTNFLSVFKRAKAFLTPKGLDIPMWDGSLIVSSFHIWLLFKFWVSS